MKATEGMKKPHVRIFDTTLRDGEQAPKCSMKTSEKLRVTEKLIQLNVDIIEAGFPAASIGDFEAVQAIAKICNYPGSPRVCGLARLNKEEIDRCAEAIAPAYSKRIHVFIATSEIHMKHKLKLEPLQVLGEIERWVTYACQKAAEIGADVEFSCEDATRSDFDFMVSAFQLALNCGATTLNVPDTVGYTLPGLFGRRIAELRKRLHFNGCNLTELEGDEIIISVHGHDDLGLATANFLAGVENGARQIECTVLGIGERAGNGAMEEVVMALHTHRTYFGVDTQIRTEHFMESAQTLAEIIGYEIPRNKAIVGGNAFAHEAGIHVDGVLKNALTYEHMNPQDVGQKSSIVLGKHSGRAAYRSRVQEFGLYDVLGDNTEAREDAIVDLTRRCKVWADEDKKVPNFILLQIIAKEILGLDLSEYSGTVEDLLHTIWSAKSAFVDPFKFSHYETHTVSTEGCHLRVHIWKDGRLISQSVQADTEINALFIACSRLAQKPQAVLELWDGHGTKGSAGEGEINVRVRCDQDCVEVRHLDDDIYGGTGRAFIRTFNLIELNRFIRAHKAKVTV